MCLWVVVEASVVKEREVRLGRRVRELWAKSGKVKSVGVISCEWRGAGRIARVVFLSLGGLRKLC